MPENKISIATLEASLAILRTEFDTTLVRQFSRAVDWLMKHPDHWLDPEVKLVLDKLMLKISEIVYTSNETTLKNRPIHILKRKVEAFLNLVNNLAGIKNSFGNQAIKGIFLQLETNSTAPAAKMLLAQKAISRLKLKEN